MYLLIVDCDVGIFVYYFLDVDVFIINLLTCFLSACYCILESSSLSLSFFFFSFFLLLVVLLYTRIE